VRERECKGNNVSANEHRVFKQRFANEISSFFFSLVSRFDCLQFSMEISCHKHFYWDIEEREREKKIEKLEQHIFWWLSIITWLKS